MIPPDHIALATGQSKRLRATAVEGSDPRLPEPLRRHGQRDEGCDRAAPGQVVHGDRERQRGAGARLQTKGAEGILEGAAGPYGHRPPREQAGVVQQSPVLHIGDDRGVHLLGDEIAPQRAVRVGPHAVQEILERVGHREARAAETAAPVIAEQPIRGSGPGMRLGWTRDAAPVVGEVLDREALDERPIDGVHPRLEIEVVEGVHIDAEQVQPMSGNGIHEGGRGLPVPERFYRERAAGRPRLSRHGLLRAYGDPEAAVGAGKMTSTVVPCPGSLSTATRAAWASA